MKTLSFLTLMMTFTTVNAGTLKCAGIASFSSVYSTMVENKSIALTIDNFEGSHGSILTFLEGDAINYDGELFLDGSYDHVIMDSDNGDIVKVHTKLIDDKHLEFTQTFFNKNELVRATVGPEVLSCK